MQNRLLNFCCYDFLLTVLVRSSNILQNQIGRHLGTPNTSFFLALLPVTECVIQYYPDQCTQGINFCRLRQNLKGEHFPGLSIILVQNKSIKHQHCCNYINYLSNSFGYEFCTVTKFKVFSNINHSDLCYSSSRAQTLQILNINNPDAY